MFGMPLNTLSSLSWKTSPATLNPNGSHNHLDLPHGMLNVVIRLLPLSSATCQYPDVVSSRVKSVEPCRSSRMSSIILILPGSNFFSVSDVNSKIISYELMPIILLYHLFCFLSLLRFFRSMHNLREPSGFFTGTIGLTHSVYCHTSVMMPSFGNLSRSAVGLASR